MADSKTSKVAALISAAAAVAAVGVTVYQVHRDDPVRPAVDLRMAYPTLGVAASDSSEWNMRVPVTNVGDRVARGCITAYSAVSSLGMPVSVPWAIEPTPINIEPGQTYIAETWMDVDSEFGLTSLDQWIFVETWLSCVTENAVTDASAFMAIRPSTHEYGWVGRRTPAVRSELRQFPTGGCPGDAEACSMAELVVPLAPPTQPRLAD